MKSRWRPMVLRICAVLAAAALGSGVTSWLQPDPPQLSLLEIGFAQDMSAHHQQAIQMTDMLAADASPDVRAVADQIRVTQLNEIGQMTGWLQVANAAAVSPRPMAWMSAMPGMSSAHTTLAAMPGKASPQDLEQLESSTGRASEIRFLQLMTRHHQGGIEMAAHAAQRAETDAVRRTALVMVDEQTQELMYMAMLLEQRDAAPLPYPS